MFTPQGRAVPANDGAFLTRYPPQTAACWTDVNNVPLVECDTPCTQTQVSAENGEAEAVACYQFNVISNLDLDVCSIIDTAAPN